MARGQESSGDLIADRRFAYAEALFTEHDFVGAADLFAQIVQIVPKWAPAQFGLGKSALEAGDAVAARAALEAALRLDPTDCLGASVLLARLDCKAAMPDAYVAALFDDYAPRFDSHLIQALDYRAPEVLMEALATVRTPARFARGLDLGCGTGLMAGALVGACPRLVGVDLSAAMLARAHSTGLYERLACAELLAFLKGEPAHSADLVIAADVFCYVPALAPVFAEAMRVLEIGGSLAFTVQVHDGEGVLIGPDCRVHHAVSHITALLDETPFEIAYQRLVSSRKDRGVPVPGAVFVAIRR